ncbi:hypothetical protein G7085_16605 [Tessaracoccus sp. HDW20]|uniref:hypothetical protein n=1 Tax=Tessaracoccus coleopterorum TaxID=2714950 RepID=UPI0018D308AA|nr:hypothetical protein [Tessaracoccus coleopterorum]NHB85669.1 hypothetical protein [Tessaracoccus coleopterorum]
MIVASVLGAAVLGAGVGLGMFFFKGSTPVAAQGLPADVLFAAEVNLAPSNVEKLALKGIADRYPSLSSGDMETDYKSALFAVIAGDSEDAPITRPRSSRGSATRSPSASPATDRAI